MHLIEIVGPIDKRMVVYPLMKAATLAGKVLLIGDDPNLCRFCEGFAFEGSLDKSDIRIVPELNNLIVQTYVERSEQSYDYVIAVSTSALLKDVNTFVYCHGGGYAMIEPEKLDTLGEEFEYPDVLISMTRPTAKGVKYLTPSSDTMGYVWSCEEARSFVPCKVRSLADLSAELFASALSMDKNSYMTLLKR